MGDSLLVLFGKIQSLLLLLISLLLPMHIWIPELSLFCFLFWLLQGNWKFRITAYDWQKNRMIFFLLCGYFFYIVVSVLFFSPYKAQLSELERRWALAIFPLIFMGSPQLKSDRKLVDYILILYCLGAVCTSIYSLFRGDFSFFVPSVFLGNRIRFSTTIVLAMAILIYLSYKNRGKKWFLLFSAVFQFFYLFSIYTASSRSGIVATICLGVFVLIFFLLKKNLAIIYKVCLFILIFGVSYVLATNQRMSQDLVKSHRTNIYKSAFDTGLQGLRGVNFFVGMGAEASLDLFHQNLKKIGEQVYSHPHNDFFSIFLKRGIIGEFFFLLILGVAWCRGLKNKNFLLLSFLLISLIYHLFNGVFEIRHDIYLYYYFYCFFMFVVSVKNKKYKEKFN